ncbi:MAG: CBS domain-containing protein [Candidatus Micrarchaeota archaeon]|nr:CBS domain-containing protein [Candidatus Micrarchaeota archaeon]
MQLISLEEIDGSEPVSKALSKIKETGLPVLVYSQKKLLGIIEEKDFSYKKVSLDTKAKNLAKKVPIVSADSSLSTIAKKFYSGKNKIILVEQKNKIAGAIDRWALLSLLLEEQILKNKKVKDYMVSPVIAVAQDAKVSFANSLMKQHKVRRLAVVDGSKLVGIISMFDILSANIAQKERKPLLSTKKTDIRNLEVKSFMKTTIYTIGQEKTLEDAAKEMIKNKTTNLIVVNQNKNPIGIITIKDIIKEIALSEEEIPVFVSNLENEYKELVVSSVQNFAKKFKKIFSLKHFSLHFKNDGSKKEIQGKIKAKEDIFIKAEGFSVQDALNNFLFELKTIILKKKGKKTTEKKKLKEIFEEGEENV